MIVQYTVGLYTCYDCLCPIVGEALLTTDEEGLRRSYHPARCDLVKPGTPQKWPVKVEHKEEVN